MSIDNEIQKRKALSIGKRYLNDYKKRSLKRDPVNAEEGKKKYPALSKAFDEGKANSEKQLKKLLEDSQTDISEEIEGLE